MADTGVITRDIQLIRYKEMEKRPVFQDPENSARYTTNRFGMRSENTGFPRTDPLRFKISLYNNVLLVFT
ncbi:hypothetical protein NO263_14010 [Gluconacetobacter entanii]|uniref:Uncharacterized protein n=1 Tax=Gluconacetobacter entanii TaxID=108528 RepID=A0ABT3K9C4_9PROT|nr:hypothetical protein [Gluconacetobacter entanii]MCW4591696.1 hypothetical protein [Gluconacetobacter entanii]MCW4593099.1 hypothetical protein [Gluconacetobacter entanii]NPC89893.1 hypothetical protein [Gluconacetobacter entanii]